MAASREELLGEAKRLLPGYLEATTGLKHESKGIRRSELFFFYALTTPLHPARIIESGRARAQSTLVLARLFPQIAIVSLESDPDSPDAAIAEERLRPYQNVECRFGDSLRLLAKLVEPGDVVLIDGPKDFRALKLAFHLLASSQVSAVFVHDLWPASPARSFIDRHLPSALLSDEPSWVQHYAFLDKKKRSMETPTPGSRRAYGATLGYFGAKLDNYARRLWQCRLAQGADRLRETTRRLSHQPSSVRPKDFAIVSR
ncbi:MAG: hypothetical protein ACR2G0_04660 [Chthoniobacterales bacterium]